ncbi:MAG TPA: hypothetical protein VMY59_03945 [Candidatus Thermoplasmatota archaeon]|nr:hypothetical protein [Candidatus Thermoplasmatota archaeon]
MADKHFTDEYLDDDEYMENTPLEARFDVSTISSLCVEAIPRHAAYGMMLDEYQKQRARFMQSDTSEKKRLSFYLPAFYGRVAVDLSIMSKISHYRFLILLCELGIITFQHDFYDNYHVIRNGRHKICSLLNTESNRSLYMQLDQHVIELDSGRGYRGGKAKHFVPTVPVWLYNAVSETATNLNMGNSDFVFLCLCIGIVNALPEDDIPKLVGEDLNEIIHGFELGLSGYTYQIEDTLKRMKC